MSNLLHPAAGAQQCVTASDLVRHFGLWQERAARAPVYILHRGRPRLVLTSLDVMDALCAPHAAGDTGHAAALLDADEGVTLIVGREGAIRGASLGARRRLGEAAAIGAPATGLAAVAGELLIDAIGRVGDSGVAEALDLAVRRYPARRWRCRIDPFPDGCLIRVDDLSVVEDLQATGQALTATMVASAAAGTICARIGPRGYLVDPPASLSRLTGVAAESLAAARFVTLFDVASRVGIGDAIEAALRDPAPWTVTAALLVRGAQARVVTVGLAALSGGSQPAALIAAISPVA